MILGTVNSVIYLSKWRVKWHIPICLMIVTNYRATNEILRAENKLFKMKLDNN